MVVEGLCKRLQLWEEFDGTRVNATSEVQTLLWWAQQRALFMGWEGNSLGQALVCPALHLWISERLAVHSVIPKSVAKLDKKGCSVLLFILAASMTPSIKPRGAMVVAAAVVTAHHD